MFSTLKHYRALSWLVLAAILLRGLIPAGMMPGAAKADNRLFPLVICTSYGTSTVMVGADKIPDAPPLPDHSTHEEAGQMAPCAFAASFGLGAPSFTAFFLTPIYDVIAAVFPADVLPPGAIYKSYRSQAPPLS